MAWKPLRRGEQPSAAALNELAIYATEYVAAGGGATVSRSAAGLSVTQNLPERLNAKITGASGSSYNWAEVYRDADSGLWVDLTDGRTGTTTVLPAIERNGTTGIASGTRVELVLDPSTEFYLFDAPGAGGGTLPGDTTITIQEGDTLTIVGEGDSPPGSVLIQAPIRYGVTYLSLTTGTYDDFDLNSYGPGPVFSIAADGPVTFTGIIPPQEGAAFTIINESAYQFTIENEDAGSAAANRVLTDSGLAFTVEAGGSLSMQHSPTAGSGDEGRFSITSFTLPGGSSFAGGGGSGGLAWVPLQFDYADLADASPSNDIEAYSLPAGWVLHQAILKHSESFSGGSITTYTLSLGIAGDATRYIGNIGVDVPVSDTVFDSQGNPDGWIESFSLATSIRLYATSTGDDLNEATQGIVDVWLLVSDPNGGGGGGGGGSLSAAETAYFLARSLLGY